ncbi:keratin-associated protein 10-4-like [Montipora capricornis]|uniref:keratin-associated protein 10-4-like n=1 Tax=Montipora capricornis TaxID=246305 RepID=UPI0035F1C959
MHLSIMFTLLTFQPSHWQLFGIPMTALLAKSFVFFDLRYQKMLLIALALIWADGTTFVSASNKTSCDHMRNNRSCVQDIMESSVFSSMYCGFTVPYDSCDQMCQDSKCDTIECRSLVRCGQNCFESRGCGSMTCNSKACDQHCSTPVCDGMKCVQDVESCEQVTARSMMCEARACKQTCGHSYESHECRMFCPARSGTCSQFGEKSSNATMFCVRDMCNQRCGIEGRCNMACWSPVPRPGICEQECSSGTCENMVCIASNCTQKCRHGDCNMVCSLGSKTCTQTANTDRINSKVDMECHSEICGQNCSNGTCNMTCSAAVKHCYQTCENGSTCIHKCDAEHCVITNCSIEEACFEQVYSRSTTTTNPTTTRKSTSATVPTTVGHPSASAPPKIRLSVLKVFVFFAFSFCL